MSNLLKEAIADANKVKELAYENAKAAIEEAFQPRIQQMISAKLAEEEGEEMDDLDMGGMEDEFSEPAPEPAPEPTMEPAPEPEFDMTEPMMDIEETEDEFMDDEMAFESTDPLDEEFAKIIAELESEDLQEKDDSYDHKVSKTKKNLEEKDDAYHTKDSKTKKNLEEMDDLEMSGEDENLDDLELESLISKLEEEGDYEEDDMETSTDIVESLKRENNRLRRENKNAHRALAEMKTAVNEVNLLNSKLMYATKIIQSFDLTESQKEKVLENFDRAGTVKDVKLIYTTLSEHFNDTRQVKRSPRRRAIKRVNESASRTIRTAKASKPKQQLDERVVRLQELAGIKPLREI